MTSRVVEKSICPDQVSIKGSAVDSDHLEGPPSLGPYRVNPRTMRSCSYKSPHLACRPRHRHLFPTSALRPAQTCEYPNRETTTHIPMCPNSCTSLPSKISLASLPQKNPRSTNTSEPQRPSPTTVVQRSFVSRISLPRQLNLNLDDSTRNRWPSITPMSFEHGGGFVYLLLSVSSLSKSFRVSSRAFGRYVCCMCTFLPKVVLIVPQRAACQRASRNAGVFPIL
jgi:hypothetical protein